MDFGIFYFDVDVILSFFERRAPLSVFIDLLGIVGWIPLAALLLFVGLFFLVEYKEKVYTSKWKWVLLAVDVPLLNVQTPKAVEQLFSHLAGALGHVNIAEKYHHGFKQRWFSFEIISMGGYIQFLIRTEVMFRDLVEAAVYAQYPEAEITEVEEYTDDVPDHYPNDTHDMWAADFGLAEDDAYPIRTYREFEHSISKDTVLKDPMGTFLESFSRIGPGEQMWVQILVEPVGSHWKEEAMETIKEVIGDESGHAHGGNIFIDTIADAPMKLLEQVGDVIFAREPSEHEEKEEKVTPNLVQYLTPGQKTLVEAMEAKISKIVFKTKIRAVYVARKDVFHPERGVHALLGAISQFNVLNANSIVPTVGVTAFYFLKQQRISYHKLLLMKAYKKRKMKAGGNPFYLNIEELATVWHFPMSHVKTPLVQKSEGKRAEPPSGLPVEGGVVGAAGASFQGPQPPYGTPHGYPTDAGTTGGFPPGTKFG